MLTPELGKRGSFAKLSHYSSFDTDSFYILSIFPSWSDMKTVSRHHPADWFFCSTFQLSFSKKSKTA